LNIIILSLGIGRLDWALVKLDLVTGILLLLQASFYLYADAAEIIINGVAYVITVVWALAGFYAVREESVKTMRFFFIFAIVEPAYTIYKLVVMKTDPQDYPDVSYNQFAFTGGFALIVRGVLLYYAYAVYTNYGKGLYPIWHRQAPKPLAPSQLPAGSDQNSPTARKINSDDSEHSRLIPNYVEPLCVVL